MWSPDGVAAIDYPHSFHPELAPAHLAYALTQAGIRPPFPWGAPFRYAELGCGQGLTSLMLAAIHPQGAFEAVDALPGHMDMARGLARAAALSNVAFATETFADYAARPGDHDLDVIALHGVWTWVAPQHRAQLAEIALRRLKPGGVLYVSYNCLPGWQADLPFRRLLLDLVAAADGTLPERIAAALDTLNRQAAAGRFDDAPTTLRLLRSLDGKSDGYVAHEFLNRHWQPFHPAEVAGQLAEAGLTFAASATLADHLSPPGPECRFRRDLFVKDPVPLSAAERTRLLAAQRIGLVVPPSEVPDSVVVGGGAFSTADPLPRCASGAAAPLPPGDPAREGPCRRLNAAILDSLHASTAIRQLAAPGLGTGIVVDLLDRLFLLAEKDGADPPAFAWDWLRARGKLLRRDGEWLHGEDNLAELRRLHARFRTGQAPTLV